MFFLAVFRVSRFFLRCSELWFFLCSEFRCFFSCDAQSSDCFFSRSSKFRCFFFLAMFIVSMFFPLRLLSAFRCFFFHHAMFTLSMFCVCAMFKGSMFFFAMFNVSRFFFLAMFKFRCFFYPAMFSFDVFFFFRLSELCVCACVYNVQRISVLFFDCCDYQSSDVMMCNFQYNSHRPNVICVDCKQLKTNKNSTTLPRQYLIFCRCRAANKCIGK